MTVAAPEIRYKLSPAQKAVFTDSSRFRVVVAGRRFGKTHLACLCLLQEALAGPGRICWYLAPTYRQGKEIMWRMLRRIIPREYVAKPNETDLSLLLHNDSVIAIRGTENPDSLRGPGLDFAALDEFAQMPNGKLEVWEAIIRPALAVSEGRALFITTPQGMGWDYDLYLLGQEQRDGFKSWTFTTLDGGQVSVAEVEAARASTDPRMFRQEYEASFEVLAGRVYDNFERTLNVDDHVKDTGGEILVGQDFNVNPMASVVGVAVGDELHVLEALEIRTSNTEEVAAEIGRRYPGRPIVVCPDPSGNQRRSSAPAGQTDLTILASHGFQVDVSRRVIPVVDRINAVQIMLRDANDRRRLRIHPRAKLLIRALDGMTYKEGTNIPDKTTGLDHITDALGYLVWQRFNLLNPRFSITETYYA